MRVINKVRSPSTSDLWIYTLDRNGVTYYLTIHMSNNFSLQCAYQRKWQTRVRMVRNEALRAEAWSATRQFLADQTRDF